MKRKGNATSSKMLGDASSNTGVHFQSEVNFVNHVSIMSRSRLPAPPCFLLRLNFGPFPSFGYPFPVRSCPDMSCPELFYWQALLRRLHRNVPMSVPASVGRPVSVCSMHTILSESIRLLGLHTATGPHCLQHATEQSIGTLRSR